MAGLGYAAGGFGQGMTQGKQFQYERQTKNRELGQRDTQLSQEKAQQDRAHNDAIYQSLRTLRDNPNYNTATPPAQKAKIEASWKGFLTQHPEYDFSGEFNQPAPQTGNATSGAQPSQAPVATPTQAAAQPAPTGATQSAPAPPVPGAEQQPSAYNPNEQGALSPDAINSLMQENSPGFGGFTAPSSPSQQQAPSQVQTQAASVPSNQYDDAADALLARSKNPTYSVDQQNEFLRQSLAARSQGASARHAESEAKLAEANTAEVAPLAQAQIHESGARTKGLEAALPYVAPQAAATLSNTQQQTKASQFATNVEGPTKLAQAQQGLDLQKAGLMIDSAYKQADLGLRNKEINQQIAAFGLSREQWEVARQKALIDMAKQGIDAQTALNTPNFNVQTLMKAITDNAYQKDKITGRSVPGPTIKAFNQMQDLIQRGQGPNAFSRYLGDTGQQPGQPVAGAPTQDNINKFINAPGVSASDKVQQLKLRGIQIPPALAKQAASEMRTGGGNRGSR